MDRTANLLCAQIQKFGKDWIPNLSNSGSLDGLIQVAKSAPLEAYELLVREPVRRLWLRGPWLGGYGFWNGRDPAYICAHLSTLSTASVLERPQDCKELIERQFDSFMVGFEFLLYVAVVYVALRIVATLAVFQLRRWMKPA